MGVWRDRDKARAYARKYYREHRKDLAHRVRTYARSHQKLMRKRAHTWMLKRYELWLVWFTEQGYHTCSKCGFSGPFCALDFHHVRGPISLRIGKFISGHVPSATNIKIVQKELRKCILLCANCHRIQHLGKRR